MEWGASWSARTAHAVSAGQRNAALGARHSVRSGRRRAHDCAKRLHAGTRIVTAVLVRKATAVAVHGARPEGVHAPAAAARARARGTAGATASATGTAGSGTYRRGHARHRAALQGATAA